MGKQSKDRFKETLADLGFASYEAYLTSSHWDDLKSRYRSSKLFKGECFGCGRGGPFEFHHRTYKRLGHEWLMDIVPVCRPCHLEAHRLEVVQPKGGLWGAAKKLRRSHYAKPKIGKGKRGTRPPGKGKRAHAAP